MAEIVSGDKPASMSEVAKFFGYDGKNGNPSLATFRAHWQELTEADKTQLKAGIGNGSITY